MDIRFGKTTLSVPLRYRAAVEQARNDASHYTQMVLNSPIHTSIQRDDDELVLTLDGQRDTEVGALTVAEHSLATHRVEMDEVERASNVFPDWASRDRD